MALLLAFYQKMRLIRERNKLTLDLSSISRKKSRVEQNIKNREKFYTSIMENLKNNVTNMGNSYGMYIRNQAGLGCNSFDNMWGGNSITGYVMTCLTDAINTNHKDNKLYGKNVNELITAYNTPFEKGADGKIDYAKTAFGSEDAYRQFGNLLSQAQMAQTQVSNSIQMQTDTYKNQLSVFLQAKEEEIEAAKDQELGQLSFEETMIDLDKTAIEQRLEEIKAEMQSYDGILKEEAQNAAPKFGV